GRLRAGPGEPEPGACLHAAVAGPAPGAAADCVPRPARPGAEPAWHGAGVSGGHLTAGDSRSPLAISRRSPPSRSARAGTLRDSRGSAAFEQVDRDEPRRAEAPGTSGSTGRT